MREFVKFVVHDWYFAIPMFAMSLVAFSLVVWRFLLNRNADTNISEFLPRFQERLTREGVDGASRLCLEERGLIPSKLFMAGLETSKQGLAAMRRAMANAVELEVVPQLNFLLPSILAIAKIATMVGLLGTVISMIGTFAEIEEVRRQQNKGDIAGSAGAIGLALFATALGLVTAIPLVFAHVMFKGWIANFEVKMKSAAQKLLLIMQAHKPAPAVAGAKSGDTQTIARK
ncbi:MAG: MotA/TolQ/ExbB proton channel family protein [Gemmataceae bacterium]|nr:MotA/TolQ/ExbB proton channel family protein [Gemmataceae bacterium]